MANFIISGVGAGIGYMVGGPIGAQIGWMVGSYLSADKQRLGQPTIGDLRVQTSSYGTNIPIPVGLQRVAGNVIWAANKKTYQVSSGGGGKGGSPRTTATGYTISMAISICKGPILGVRRVWADGELVVDARSVPNRLIGNLYTGTDTQMPSPVMESALGVGNVPAYRGIAYIVLEDYDLGIAGRIPNFSFEIVKQGGI